jgi:phosphate butyryltransferase
MTKVDIVQNAVDLARACGIDKPLVSILSAVETINPAIASTLDAAILSKMAERGQIRRDRRWTARHGQCDRPRGRSH